MPELPEVETVRRGLADRLKGFQINELKVFRERAIASPGGSKVFIKMMRGLSVGSWERRGKYLIGNLYKGKNSQEQSPRSKNSFGLWVVHLRMTGQFQWHAKKTITCPYTRVSFWNQKGEELRFVDTRSFGQMWWVPPEIAPEDIINGLRTMGPEPFSNAFNTSYLKKALKGKKRPIKNALLDQTLVAGAGNIYADESLFRAGILPQTPSGHLKEEAIKKLCSSLKEVLEISIGEGGTTFSDFRDLSGASGKYGGQAWVYKRSGQPCRKCGATIRKNKMAGRGTHWCPSCQK